MFSSKTHCIAVLLDGVKLVGCSGRTTGVFSKFAVTEQGEQIEYEIYMQAEQPQLFRNHFRGLEDITKEPRMNADGPMDAGTRHDAPR